MKQMRRYVVPPARLGFAVVTLLLAGGVPATAQTTKASPIVDVDNPARLPFQKTLCTPGFGNPQCPDNITIPADKRLVIEYVSGSCTSATTDTASLVEIQTIAGGQVASSHAVTQFMGVSTVKHYSVAQLTRIYADPNTPVHVAVSRFPGVGSASCIVTLSGHRVSP